MQNFRQDVGADKAVDRSGLAVIWLIGSAALIIAALSLVLEAGWLQLCRSEVKVIAESAALAGARSWGLAVTNDAAARTAAKAAAAQIVTGSTVEGSNAELLALAGALAASNDAAAVNNNGVCPSALPAVNTVVLLGDFESTTCVLAAGTVPASASRRACLVQFSFSRTSPFTSASRTVKARAVAVWDPAVTPNRSRLVSLSAVTCP
ncbi:MAG: hypothetical protein RIT02_2880 [Planctomycetota bacterium]|jgi:hypothetical protein